MASFLERILDNPLLKGVSKRGAGTLENPSNSLAAWVNGGYLGADGTPISVENALAVSTIYACARILEETLGGLSCEVFEEKQNGDIVPAKSHPLYRIVNSEPSHLYSSFTFFGTNTAIASLAGSAKARIYSNRRGQITKLEILNPYEWKTEYLEDKDQLVHINKKNQRDPIG